MDPARAGRALMAHLSAAAGGLLRLRELANQRTAFQSASTNQRAGPPSSASVRGMTSLPRVAAAAAGSCAGRASCPPGRQPTTGRDGASSPHDVYERAAQRAEERGGGTDGREVIHQERIFLPEIGSAPNDVNCARWGAGQAGARQPGMALWCHDTGRPPRPW